MSRRGPRTVPRPNQMLKKIDCILLKVPDVEAAAELYKKAFGLRELWRDDRQLGLGMSDTDAEIVLHSDDSIPVQVDVNYLVEDVNSAVDFLSTQGFEVLQQPFEIVIGKCAVVKDSIGQVWSILDLTKGPRNAKIPA